MLLGSSSSITQVFEGWEQHPGKDRDYRDSDEKLDDRKVPSAHSAASVGAEWENFSDENIRVVSPNSSQVFGRS